MLRLMFLLFRLLPEVPVTASSDRIDSRDFRIRFCTTTSEAGQDEESFEFDHDGRTRRLRIHDYADIFRVPGLYEALVYDKLECSSPPRLADLVASVLTDWPDEVSGPSRARPRGRKRHHGRGASSHRRCATWLVSISPARGRPGGAARTVRTCTTTTSWSI